MTLTGGTGSAPAAALSAGTANAPGVSARDAARGTANAVARESHGLRPRELLTVQPITATFGNGLLLALIELKMPCRDLERVP